MQIRVLALTGDISNISAETEFGSDIFVFLEMIDVLLVEEVDIIDVLLFTHKLEVINVGLHVWVDTPVVLLNKASFEIFISEGYDYFTLDIVLFLVIYNRLLAKTWVKIVLDLLLGILIRLIRVMKILVIFHELLGLEQFPQPRKVI